MTLPRPLVDRLCRSLLSTRRVRPVFAEHIDDDGVTWAALVTDGCLRVVAKRATHITNGDMCGADIVPPASLPPVQRRALAEAMESSARVALLRAAPLADA